MLYFASLVLLAFLQ